MNEKEIKELLKEILELTRNKNILWRLDGSANLRVQGIITEVKDLDITTNNEGIKTFSNCLNKYLVKEFFNQKINARSLLLQINGFEIEINSYNKSELNMLDKIRTISWNNLQIPILPLQYAKKFYELINRKEKVELITKHLRK